MTMIIARDAGSVNPFQRGGRSTVVPQILGTTRGKPALSAEQHPVTAGCAAAPRFIQVHPRLLALRPEDFAAYVLLCERSITGRYPDGVPLSGSDLARYFEADESGAAATRYTRALKRLIDQELAHRTVVPGRKQRYQPLWPRTQRRAAVPVGETYPHRFFIPIYLSLFEQFIGTLHPATCGPARIERFRQAPALLPPLLWSWASARWAAFRGLPRPELAPEAVAQLTQLGLLDVETVYDPIDQPKQKSDTFVEATSPTPPPSRLVALDQGVSLPIATRNNTLALFEAMYEQMRQLQRQMAEVQSLLACESPVTITVNAVDHEVFSSSQSDKMRFGSAPHSVNTEDLNTGILNTNQTPVSIYHHPHSYPDLIGGGSLSLPEATLSLPEATPTEAEELLLSQGIVAINAQRFADKPLAQVRATIEYVQKADQPFKNPAAMIVWLLQQNQFANADDRPKCWYCGEPGCTRCLAEQQERLAAHWYDHEAVWSALWHDVLANLIYELRCAELIDTRIYRVEPGRLVICANSGEAAIVLRSNRREIERAVRIHWGMALPVYVVTEVTGKYEGTGTSFAAWDKQRVVAVRPSATEYSSFEDATTPPTWHMHMASEASSPIADAMPAVDQYQGPDAYDRDKAQPQPAGIDPAVAPYADQGEQRRLVVAAAATGQSPLLQMLLGCATLEPPIHAEAQPETVIVRANTPFIAERLRQQAQAVDVVVRAIVGYSTQVLIRGPDRP